MTWLFVVASACADIALSVLDVDGNVQAAMLLGQSFVAGGWLVLGHAHRLLRAGVFVAAMLGLALWTSLSLYGVQSRDSGQAWGLAVGLVAFLSGVAAGATYCFQVLIKSTILRPAATGRRTRWQFPVAELFGWMIVVAVASAALRLATLASIDSRWDQFVATILFALVGALLMALFLGESKDSGPLSALIALAAVASLFGLLPLFVPTFERQIAMAVAGAYVYIAAFIGAQRLDGAMLSDRAGEAWSPRLVDSIHEGE